MQESLSNGIPSVLRDFINLFTSKEVEGKANIDWWRVRDAIYERGSLFEGGMFLSILLAMFVKYSLNLFATSSGALISSLLDVKDISSIFFMLIQKII